MHALKDNFLHNFEGKYEDIEGSKDARNAPNSGARFSLIFLSVKSVKKAKVTFMLAVARSNARHF